MFKLEDTKVFLRGDIVPFERATISVANSGFLYGLGVFTGIRAHYNEKQKKLFIFRPDAHFERFHFSCKLFRYSGFTENYDYEKFLGLLQRLIAANNIHEDTYIRVSNFTDENRITPKFVQYKDALSVFLYPLGDYVPTGGMRCKISSWTRVEDNALPASPKSHGGYVNTAFAKSEALLDGYDEAIFLNSKGNVVEGSAENVFVVRRGEIFTPPLSDNILEGITRDSVISIARDLGYMVHERAISRTELYRADEVFLTGTGAKVSPVVEIDRYPVGTGQIGQVSKKLQEMYFDAVKGNVPKYSHWLVDAYEMRT